MIQTIDTKLKSTRIMNEEEFSDLCNRGWTLIAILQEQSFTPGQNGNCPGTGSGGSGPCGHGNYPGGCYTQVALSVAMPITITKYVMGRDEKTVIGDLSEGLQSVGEQLLLSEQDRENLRKQWVGSRKEVEEYEKEVVSLERSAENYRKQIANQDNRVVGHLETINKMEGDLAKVRNHIGSKQFNDCLNEKEDTTK